MSYQELTPELASSFGVQRTRGALVNEVSPGPSRQGRRALRRHHPRDCGAGGAEGRDLLRAVLQNPVGQIAEPDTVLRDGQPVKLQVTNAARPVTARRTRAAPGAPGKAKANQPRRGPAGLTPELARRIGYQGPGGVVVARILPGSPADRSGLMRGDVIEQVNHKPVGSAQKLQEALRSPEALLKVHRQGGTFFAALNASD